MSSYDRRRLHRTHYVLTTVIHAKQVELDYLVEYEPDAGNDDIEFLTESITDHLLALKNMMAHWKARARFVGDRG